jgi:hypothetical protein
VPQLAVREQLHPMFPMFQFSDIESVTGTYGDERVNPCAAVCAKIS